MISLVPSADYTEFDTMTKLGQESKLQFKAESETLTFVNYSYGHFGLSCSQYPARTLLMR